jgi:hypothetical protein
MSVFIASRCACGLAAGSGAGGVGVGAGGVGVGAGGVGTKACSKVLDLVASACCGAPASNPLCSYVLCRGAAVLLAADGGVPTAAEPGDEALEGE